MKKLLLLAAVAVFTAGTMKAQDKPDSFGVGPVDTYCTGAYDLTTKKAALAASMDQLKKDMEAAGKLPSKEQRVDFVNRATEIETGYKSMPDDVKKLMDAGKDATAAAKDCGMKAAKCTKACKAATEQLTALSKGLPEEGKMAAELKAKAEAMAAVTK
jgi:hypothetical protein